MRSFYGEDDFLDEIIAAFELDVPLETASDEIINEIVSQLGDDFFDDCECPSGIACPT